VLGSPEVVHDGHRLTFSLRKAQALLLYLAVEGGMHLRSKLAAFLWPDSEPHDARNALRNTLALLRRLLADVSPAGHSHLLIEGELLGLNPQAPVELDLQVVQLAYKEAQQYATLPAEPQRTALLTQVQQALALVRGSFLDGLVLGEDAPFNEWLAQQQRQWQVRLLLLFERLSAWQEVAGEVEQACATLTRWLGLDPLSEEAARRLMRVQLALGNPNAAWQVYLTCRARLAEELGVKPSAETVALAEHIRAIAARSPGRTRVRPSTGESQPPTELVGPLVGRATAFSQLVGHYQLAREGQPQALLVVGEAGIGKTRLAREFVAWARAQGAEVLSGLAFEAGGRLPYQLLVEALRPRLEEENAPEDLLEDLWLAELSHLLPELRVRYPDLPAPTQDELAAKLRLFEAVARLLDALAQHGPLVLLLDDLQWVDGASLDLLRYLARHWITYGSRVLLLGVLRSEGVDLNQQLSAQLSDLSRDLPLTQVPLGPLSQEQALQLVQGLLVEEALSSWPPEERNERALARRTLLAEPATSPASQRSLVGLGDFLFAQTGGQPFYLLETLKLLRERQLLVPRLAADGIWKLEPTAEMAAALAQERLRHELLPPSVRAMIQAGLAKLQPPARQLVMASAVLGKEASAEHLWRLAELGEQAGLEALEEAVKRGLLREEAAGRQGTGQSSRYRFAHQLMHDVVYTELGEARRHLLHQRALTLLQAAGARSAELAYHALMAGQAEAAYRYSVQAGDEAVAIFAVEDAIWHYEQARALYQEQVPQTKLELVPARGLPSIPVQERASQARVNPANFPEFEHLYVSLGRAYAFLNAWEQAREAYEELLDYAQQQRLPRLICMTLNRMAILAVHQSFDKPKAQALLDEAWRMAQTSHDQRALAETEWNQAQITALVWKDSTRALPHAAHALELARGIRDKELEARSLSSLGMIHLHRGDFQEAIHALEASLALYAALGTEQTAWPELSLHSFTIGTPLTQPLMYRATEALCWGVIATAQLHAGQVHNSIRSGRRALALSKEIKNDWVQVNSRFILTHALLEAGAYEEALVLMQDALAPAWTCPPTILFKSFLFAQGGMYHFLQLREEAHRTLEEAETLAGKSGRGAFRLPILSRLCMNAALEGEWEAAYRYAMQAIALRKNQDGALILLDFFPYYETEALLRGGNESLAREEVQRLGERLGPSPRFRLPYLRSLAVLAAWDGESEQAIGHLREADQLAADLRLPGERWQIQAALGSLYEAEGLPAQAHIAFAEANSIIQALAQGIEDKTLRSRFLASPQIHQVVQQARGGIDPKKWRLHSWRLAQL
jgi:DNA-binding SARP family transcriptional activator